MTEQQQQGTAVTAASPNAHDGGETVGQGEPSAVITLTPAQLEARLARERQKFSDYDDLRKAKEKLDALEAERMSELEKAQKKAADAEAARDQALQQANDRLIRAAFVAEAAKAGAVHPEDAFALADKAGVKIADDGAVTGAAEAVKALVDGGRLVMSGRPQAPPLDGGEGGGNRPTEKPKSLSEDELLIAHKMGLTAEQYQKGKKP